MGQFQRYLISQPLACYNWLVQHCIQLKEILFTTTFFLLVTVFLVHMPCQGSIQFKHKAKRRHAWSWCCSCLLPSFCFCCPLGKISLALSLPLQSHSFYLVPGTSSLQAASGCLNLHRGLPLWLQSVIFICCGHVHIQLWFGVDLSWLWLEALDLVPCVSHLDSLLLFTLPDSGVPPSWHNLDSLFDARVVILLHKLLFFCLFMRIFFSL